MYKVFINDKSIVFTEIRNVDNFPDCTPLSLSDSTDNIEFFIDNVLKHKAKTFILLVTNLENDWNIFLSNFTLITAAGGLISNENGDLLFIYRNGKWDLPKGKVEQNESFELASVREVKEECGLINISLDKKILITYHIYRAFGQTVLKPTHWFKMTSSFQELLVPQIEEGITKLKWFSKNELNIVRQNTYANITLVFETNN